MSIFLPKGVAKGEILDPKRLSDDFVSAAQISSDTTQHQWKSKAFFDSSSGEERGDEDKLIKGGPVTIHEVKQEAWLRADSSGTRMFLRSSDTVGNPLSLDRGTSDPDLYHVPYMRDLARIDGMTLTWESSYPEVVWTIFSFQFARRSIQSYVWNSHVYTEYGQEAGYYPNAGMVRLQVRLSVNGSTPPGSGVYSKMVDPSFRGLGTSQPVFRSSINDMSFLPAGSHRVEALAGQENATMDIDVTATGADSWVDELFWEEPVKPMSVVPDAGVCIGHRKLIVIRFPRGGDLGG